MTIIKVKRCDKWWKVTDQTKEEICVTATLLFSQKPYKRKTRMWWRLNDCQDFRFEGEVY